MDRFEFRASVPEGVSLKKLLDAGAHWASSTGAGGKRDTEELAGELLEAGVPENVRTQMLEHVGGKEEREACFVWAENWEPLLLFLQCRSQWMISPMGTPLGLNYASVVAVLSLHPKKKRRDLFEDIQTIEQGALTKMAEMKDGSG